jgi:hypothetical protein
MAKTYAVGNLNSITRLDNHTGPWIELDSPGEATSLWRDVMTNPFDENNVFVVGTSRHKLTLGNTSILTSNDAGVTWNVPGGTWLSVSYFYEVWCVDENIIWATASEGKVVRSIDGGATFDLVPAIVGGGVYFQTAGIHALDDQVAVVLGAPTENITQSELYVWKTIDGGTTWVVLGGSLPQPDWGNANEVGNANGIWMSNDQQRIVVGSGYNQYLSTDGGVTWNNIDQFARSGVHFTWYPTYNAFPQYFRHVGGVSEQVSESTDNGSTFNLTRSIDPPFNDAPVTIRGAHFYAPYDGYYTINNQIFLTNDGADTGTISYDSLVSGRIYEAVWTSVEIPPYVPCFELTDCAGIALPIFTQTDLTEQDGLVITLADETNHEIEGCWLVTATDITCPDTVSVAVYKCYEDCEDCLPCPEPIKEPQPRLIDPGYVTGICDPEIVEKIKCSFSDIIYKRMMSIRYMIQYCCPKDDYQIMIDYEILKLNLITSPNPTPDPCDPICSTYELTIDSLDSAITTYIDCDGEAQTLITLVGTTFIRLCALDTTPPISIVTHPDTLTDVYILEPQEECNPPYI